MLCYVTSEYVRVYCFCVHGQNHSSVRGRARARKWACEWARARDRRDDVGFSCSYFKLIRAMNWYWLNAYAYNHTHTQYTLTLNRNCTNTPAKLSCSRCFHFIFVFFYFSSFLNGKKPATLAIVHRDARTRTHSHPCMLAYTCKTLYFDCTSVCVCVVYF